MAINFPTGATINQIYSFNGQNWIYTGVYWKVYPQFADVQPITGGTFNKNTSTLSLTNSGNISVSVTGITDIFVTGGTYSNGTATFRNNTGGTFSVSGFSTAASSTTFTGGTVTGATNFTAGLSANTFSATTYQNLPTDITITGATYSNNTFTFRNNTGGTFNVLFNTLTGLTINGNSTITGTTSSGTISATTYQNLPTDVRVTGGTYNNSNGTATFTNNTGGTFNVTGFFTSVNDVRVTGATYSNNTFTYTNNTGGTFSVLFNTLTGATINGNLTITGTTQSSIFSGTTISGGTYFGNSSNLEGLSITNVLLTQFFS
jgi:hypothetical protein